jgi:hypothetical protein
MVSGGIYRVLERASLKLGHNGLTTAGSGTAMETSATSVVPSNHEAQRMRRSFAISSATSSFARARSFDFAQQFFDRRQPRLHFGDVALNHGQ